MSLLARALSVAAATALTFGLAACADQGASDGTGPIVFGVSGPVTGEQAQYGEDWKEGFDLAVETLNAEGGVGGREVQIDFQDSQGDAAQATTIAQRFVSDNRILAVMGDFSSATAMAASPIYQQGGVTQLGITNSHPDFTTTGDYIFAPSITQRVEQDIMAEGTGKLGKKAAVFYLNTDWGRSSFEVFQEKAPEYGVDVVYSTGVEEASTDFRPQLLQARDSGADVLVLITYYSTTSLLLEQANGTGLGQVPHLAVSSNFSPDLLELGGANAEGTHVATAFFPGSDADYVNAFVDAFTAKYGHAPNGFNAFAYDGVMQLAWAVENSDGSREGIRDALATGTMPSVIFGQITYNDERRIDDPKFTWIIVRDGEFVLDDQLNA